MASTPLVAVDQTGELPYNLTRYLGTPFALATDKYFNVDTKYVQHGENCSYLLPLSGSYRSYLYFPIIQKPLSSTLRSAGTVGRMGKDNGVIAWQTTELYASTFIGLLKLCQRLLEAGEVVDGEGINEDEVRLLESYQDEWRDRFIMMDDAFAELHKLEERGETPVFELFDPQLGKPNPANYLSPAFLESIESTESEDPTTRPFVRAMFAKILPMRPFTRGPPIRTSVWELDNWREINQDQKSFVLKADYEHEPKVALARAKRSLML